MLYASDWLGAVLVLNSKGTGAQDINLQKVEVSVVVIMMITMIMTMQRRRWRC